MGWSVVGLSETPDRPLSVGDAALPPNARGLSQHNPRERPPSPREMTGCDIPYIKKLKYIKQKVYSPVQVVLATEWVKHLAAICVRNQTIMTEFILFQIIAAVFKHSRKVA